MRISVAIDGPAGAGKSTIAKIIAKKLNLMYINTGAMYRAVTLEAIKSDISFNDIDKLSSLIDKMEMHFERDNLILNGIDIQEELSTLQVSSNVSNYAQVPEVREKLVYLQQKMSKKFNVIMDGRDIGTVVLKDSPYKFFLTASSEERARRRYEELISKGMKVEFNEILEDMKKRDFIDTNRETDPLRKADDAIEIDTTGLDIDGVVNKILEYIK
ncbi:(d)CMP kinase [Clostridium sp. 'White wine YQ']|uniref:(d)CMP kinase n=1 Tax=Clostridium sp. 'White wine YQ' TaxID=3027474 RepID=UPI00236624DF|nr:(d)CMP kinase [Clostridium sp. 'White wine YQ']MDD7793850.1 (d)CMP kinase [Clostridium sp. 'White wine YQ']